MFHIRFMTYNIKALTLVDHEVLAQKLVDAGVCRGIAEAKNTIRSWNKKRGFVSPAGERVIRSMLEPSDIILKVEDFWDKAVAAKAPEKLRVPA